MCLGDKEAVFLDSRAKSDSPLSTTSYAVTLKTDYFNHIPYLWLWDLTSWILCALVFSSLIILIRKRELRLIAKLDVVLNSVRNIRDLFPDTEFSPAPSDEFNEMTSTVDKMSEKLSGTTSQIESYKKQFERRTRLEQFAQVISHTTHDLKAPLEEGLDFLNHLPSAMGVMNPQELQTTIDSVKRRFQLGLESIDTALLSTAKTSSVFSEITLGQICDRFKERMLTSPKLATLKLNLSMATQLEDAVILGSLQELELVLWNLAKNTYETRTASQVDVAVSDSGDGQIKLSFSDDGPGIPPNKLEEIFLDFATFKPKGTGLGLSSCRRVIERHRGTIVAAPSDQGALFEIILPLAHGTEASTHA